MLGQQCCWAREKSRENITCSRLQHANWFHKLRFARSSRRGGLHNQMLVSAFYVLRRSKAEEKTGRESAKSKLAPIGNFKCGAAWPIIPLHPLYLNISFKIDFENCSSWLSDSGSPQHFNSNFVGILGERRKLISVFCLTSLWLDRVHSFPVSLVNRRINLRSFSLRARCLLSDDLFWWNLSKTQFLCLCFRYLCHM